MREEIQIKFTEIEHQDVWKYDQDDRISSNMEMMKELAFFITLNGIRSIIDIPSGHFTWQRAMLDEMERAGHPIPTYTGADIVESIVEKNRELHPDREFLVLDITSDPIPEGDMLIVRDCLVHLTNEQIHAALDNIRRAPVKYVALTTFPTRGIAASHPKGWEGVLNYWRALNMSAHPFSLPFPSWMIIEHKDHSNPYHDKCLGIWKKEAL